jgi:PilZ domain
MMRMSATRDVWVYWECGGLGDVSRARDLSTGGVFIETSRGRKMGELVQLHFLVPEGEISLDGGVAQAQPSEGLGLKFQGLAARDITKLSLLLERVRAAFRG